MLSIAKSIFMLAVMAHVSLAQLICHLDTQADTFCIDDCNCACIGGETGEPFQLICSVTDTCPMEVETQCNENCGCF